MILGEKMLDVCLLGVGGMMPLPDRFLTAFLLKLNGKMLLIDCGEGTQITAKMLGWGFKNIDIICFTHLHADHIAGLPGILLSINNSGRTEKIDIIGPKGIKRVYEGLTVICPEIGFEVCITELELDEDNFQSEEINIGEFYINAMLMDHKVTCFSYLIEIKRKGKFSLERAEKINIPRAYWSILQKGVPLEYDEKIYTPEMVLGDDRKGIKVAYCTDSRPLERMHDFIYNADLFVCEGMYGEEEKKESAINKKHMIFSEAASMAKEGKVKELWLTHFSPALNEPESFIQNATDIFENTIIGTARLTKRFLFEN